MNFLARLIATTMIAGLTVVAMPVAAQAIDGPTSECQDEAYVRALEFNLIEAEHEVHTLRATLEEERDEHADELRHLSRVAWETQQAHDAEMNTYSALAHDAQDALAKAQREADEAIMQRDARIISLRVKVQQLREKFRNAR